MKKLAILTVLGTLFLAQAVMAQGKTHEIKDGKLIIYSNKAGSDQVYQNDNFKTLPGGSKLQVKFAHSVDFTGEHWSDEPFMATVTKDYKENGHTIVPKGTKILGYGYELYDRRVRVRFSKMIFPSNHEAPFSGYALDKSGFVGLQAKLITKGKRRINKVAGRTASFGLRRALENIAGDGLGGEILSRGANDAEGESNEEVHNRNRQVEMLRIQSGTKFTIVIGDAF